MGQGWPFGAGPWSNDGAREVERSETRMPGVLSLWLLSLCTSKEKVTRPGGRNPNPKASSTISQVIKAASLLLLSISTPHAQAFDLADLSAQLAKPAVVRGPFIQEKHLRALPTPLTSQGQFTLSRDHGLLWLLQKPLKQDYRIADSGIARRTPAGWQQQPGQDVAAQQSRLFLAVLKGDRSGLERDFELKLSGEQHAWQLELTPHSLLLKQIFSAIRIDGGALVERIELIETQGDRTVLKLPQSQAGDVLTAQERTDLVH
jgi:hypothetical protein